jgi:hypothetical protein
MRTIDWPKSWCTGPRHGSVVPGAGCKRPETARTLHHVCHHVVASINWPLLRRIACNSSNDYVFAPATVVFDGADQRPAPIAVKDQRRCGYDAAWSWLVSRFDHACLRSGDATGELSALDPQLSLLTDSELRLYFLPTTPLSCFTLSAAVPNLTTDLLYLSQKRLRFHPNS